MRVTLVKQGKGLWTIRTKRTRREERKNHQVRDVPHAQLEEALGKLIAYTRPGG